MTSRKMRLISAGSLISVISLAVAGFAPWPVRVKPPNVLIFLLDDVGFGHIGAFGGPVNTPNIDRVAKMGLRFNNFHTTSLCSPTRAALLTGRNHHSVGTGVITEIATKDPGYTSHIPKSKFPIVEVLKNSGYSTAAFGKWHNTPLDQLRGPRTGHDQWPTDMGFEHFYGFMAGDVSQWEPTVWDDTTPVESHAKNPNYHFSVDMADQAVRWLGVQREARQDKPFFLYFATGAAHAPHHAPPEYIAKYKGQFDHGWDRVREETLERQKALGVAPPSTQLSERPKEIAKWDSLSSEEKRLYSKMQETFAGYLEHADAQFGRVLTEIEHAGDLANTIILITSDNGASGEGGLHGSINENLVFNGIPDDLDWNLAHIDEIGTKTTYNHYPAGWALAGNTPFRYWKQTTHEGGVHDPMILAWPNQFKEPGGVRSQFTHVIDVAPTLLELTGVKMPEAVRGVVQAPIEGTSFVPSINDGSTLVEKKIQYFEMLGNRAVWVDGWKATAFHGRMPWDTVTSNPDFQNDKWELFNLAEDFSEVNNLAAKFPEKLEEMKVIFDREAKKYNVYPLDDSTSNRIASTYRSLVAGVTQFKYEPGDIRISEAASPPVKNKSHTVTADLNVPEGDADGVLVACGGRFGGYSLYVQGKRVHYVHNFLGQAMYGFSASEELPAGSVTVRFEFIRTGENQGKGAIFYGDKLVGDANILRTVPKAFGIADTFDVGEDSGSPVTDAYESPFVYQGNLKSLRVDLIDE